MCDYSSILQRDQAHEEQQFAVIISIVQKQRNLTGIGRLNIMAQGSRFESSKPDLNGGHSDILCYVKMIYSQARASRWLSKCECIT